MTVSRVGYEVSKIRTLINEIHFKRVKLWFYYIGTHMWKVRITGLTDTTEQVINYSPPFHLMINIQFLKCCALKSRNPVIQIVCLPILCWYSCYQTFWQPFFLSCGRPLPKPHSHLWIAHKVCDRLEEPTWSDTFLGSGKRSWPVWTMKLLVMWHCCVADKVTK